MGTKLNQIIAVEKGIKSRSTAEMSEIYKAVQKPSLFDGFDKRYSPINEDDEKQPPQSQRVQMNAPDMIRRAAKSLSELFDVTAAKDYANCGATADVKVDGAVLVPHAPVTYLLFLEKQLTDLHTFVGALPVLDPAEAWTLDANSNLYRTAPSQTTRTRKVQKPIVLYPATPEHPAQTQLITEDVNVGTWEQVKLSGAVPEPQRKAMLERVEKLQRAVKFAREEANGADVEAKQIGDVVFNWLLGQG